MSVYVDAITAYPDEMVAPAAKRHGNQWAHMWCDAGSEDELHRIAALIGLRRDWFQDHGSLPHYDLVWSKRTLAVKAGAVEKSMREWMREVPRDQRPKARTP